LNVLCAFVFWGLVVKSGVVIIIIRGILMLLQINGRGEEAEGGQPKPK
jgi:hypothetical protein